MEPLEPLEPAVSKSESTTEDTSDVKSKSEPKSDNGDGEPLLSSSHSKFSDSEKDAEGQDGAASAESEIPSVADPESKILSVADPEKMKEAEAHAEAMGTAGAGDVPISDELRDDIMRDHGVNDATEAGAYTRPLLSSA